MMNESKKTSEQKKEFVQPELREHELLPDVTTGFVGTFSPPDIEGDPE